MTEMAEQYLKKLRDQVDKKDNKHGEKLKDLFSSLQKSTKTKRKLSKKIWYDMNPNGKKKYLRKKNIRNKAVRNSELIFL